MLKMILRKVRFAFDPTTLLIRGACMQINVPPVSFR